ncbi:HNH endonuclease family protein [Mogibacterium diversum]
MEINIDTSDVHIEHIMPVNKELWDSVSEDVHSEYLWRFGNLALMSGNYNIKMSNKPFDEKKEYYRESKIEPNRALCNYETWGSDEIAERQEEFSRYALIIWKKR